MIILSIILWCNQKLQSKLNKPGAFQRFYQDLIDLLIRKLLEQLRLIQHMESIILMDIVHAGFLLNQKKV